MPTVSPTGSCTRATSSHIDDPNAPLVSKGGTLVSYVNDAEVVLGYHEDSKGVYHGFPDLNGTSTTLNAPSAGTASGQGTQPEVITNKGTVLGSYVGGGGVTHGYIAQGGMYATMPTPQGSVATYPLGTPSSMRC